MGASSSVLSDKKVLVTYDNSSKDPLIQGLYNEIYKLPIKLYYNDLSKLEECDIIINLVSKGTISHPHPLGIRYILTFNGTLSPCV